MRDAVIGTAERIAGARDHDRMIEAEYSGVTVGDLAERWNLAASTVRDIPRSHLRYMEFGKGRLHKRRRYLLADIDVYEAWLRSGKAGGPPFAESSAEHSTEAA